MRSRARWLIRRLRRSPWISLGARAIALDLHSLAALRISSALVLLIDLFDRLRFYDVFYTDSGALPRSALEILFNGREFTLYRLSGSEAYVLLLFALQIGFAVALLVGYRTRVATAISWILLLSLQNRNPALWHTADLYLRLLLFWQLFLPCGARWSFDAKRVGGSRESGAEVSVASLALLFQVFVVYAMTAWYKSQNLNLWWTEASLLSYITNLEVYATPLGSALHHYPELLKVLTRASFLLELLGPWIALLSFPFPRVRTGLVFGFILFHVGTAFVMEVGMFPWVSIAAWCALLPREFWQRVMNVPASLPRASMKIPASKLRWLGNLAAAFALFLIVIQNYEQKSERRYVVPPFFSNIIRVLGIQQGWSMFAAAAQENGWMVVAARFSDGTSRDLMTGKPVTFDPPEHISVLFPSDRFRTYSFRLTGTYYGDHRSFYAAYLCGKYGSPQSQPRMTGFSLYYMKVRTRLVDGWPHGTTPPEKEHRYEVFCQ